MADTKTQQLEIAERLQLKWLEHMEKMLNDGTISATDMATLMRFLVASGWTLDPQRLPKGLRDKVTAKYRPDDITDERIAGRIGA